MYILHVSCGAHTWVRARKRFPSLDLYLVNFKNFGLSRMVFTLKSSDMSFLSAPGSHSWYCKHSAKNRWFFKKREKLRFVSLCSISQTWNTLWQCQSTSSRQGHRKFLVISPLAEVKYLSSDDFNQINCVLTARLETLSIRIVARCELLHSNAMILRYDFDILIADFGLDLTRIQARLLLEVGLYAAGRCDFSACIRDRLLLQVYTTLRNGISSSRIPEDSSSLIPATANISSAYRVWYKHPLPAQNGSSEGGGGSASTFPKHH